MTGPLGEMDTGDRRSSKRAWIRFAELGDAQYHAMAAGSLAWAQFMSGDQDAAVRWAMRSLRESYVQRDLGTTTISMHVAVIDRDASRAIPTRLPGSRAPTKRRASALASGRRRPLSVFIKIQNPFEMAREALSPERWEAEYEAGRRMSLGQAVDLVTELAESAG